MKNVARWLAIFAVPVALIAISGMPSLAHAATHAMTAAGHIGPQLLLGALSGLPLMVGNLEITRTKTGGVALASKSRAMQEIKTEADGIRAKLMDTKTPLTKDEVVKLSDALATLESRAALVSGFTADEEIRRGGEDPDDLGNGVERVDSPENGEKGVKKHNRSGYAARIEDFAERVKQEFGDVRSYMAYAVPTKGLDANERQRKLLEEGKTLTRAIIGGDTQGGDALLPLTQVQTIFSLANVQQGIMQRARAYNVPGRTLRIPYLLQDDSKGSTSRNRPMAGSIANVSIIGEGSTINELDPKFGQRLLTVYKYAAITRVSNEMLTDDFTGELPTEFINAVGQQALNRINEDVTIDGTNSSMPQGALYPGAWNIQVARNTAATIKTDDCFGMYSKHTHGPNSFWLASRRTVTALYAMSLTASSLVTFLKDLNGVPQMSLLGYPVVLTDLLPTLGNHGDFCLVNPDFYAFALRQALTVESTNIESFVTDLTTYKFIVRAGGLPINTGKYAYKYSGTAGVDEHAPFVYLGSINS